MEPTSSNPQSVLTCDTSGTDGEFISVGEAFKLVSPFKGNKQEVLAFIGNVDTAFAVINLAKEDILHRFVLTHISGELRTAISHRNLDNWAKLKEFLKNSYIEK
jgi:hypothetical protein